MAVMPTSMHCVPGVKVGEALGDGEFVGLMVRVFVGLPAWSKQ